DYECEIRYHPGKANVVADALSKKERVKPRRVRAMAMTIQSGIRGMIIAAQGEAFKQENILVERLHGLDQQMKRREYGSLYFLDRIWVPLVGGVRTIIMDETHKTSKIEAVKNSKAPTTPSEIRSFLGLAVYHDASNKGLGCVLMQRGKVIAYASRQLKIHEKNYTTRDLELGDVVFSLKTWRHYLYGTKSVIYTDHKSLQYILDQKELNMRQRRPLGLLQQHEKLEWKWDKITMDLITKLPRSKNRRDTIWVIVDRLTKSAHFLAKREDYSTERLARIYIDEIVARHGVPVSIISDRDGRFTSRCWQTIQKALGTRLDMSTAYHPQTDGQSYAKVSPWKGVIRFGKNGKLAPRYVGPFEILERIGPVAYQLRLPEKLSGVHDMFHVSNLKKCLAYASFNVPLDEIKIDKTLRFVEEPVKIIDHEVKKLKRSRISLVKVCWNSKRGPEFTWECGDFMKSKYPQLFVDRADESASLNIETRFPKGWDTMTTMT
nr:retrotransposon protein, putative, Ty3-gypsy subclass [Tanacetum cinerariifolium]